MRNTRCWVEQLPAVYLSTVMPWVCLQGKRKERKDTFVTQTVVCETIRRLSTEIRKAKQTHSLLYVSHCLPEIVSPASQWCELTRRVLNIRTGSGSDRPKILVEHAFGRLVVSELTP